MCWSLSRALSYKAALTTFKSGMGGVFHGADLCGGRNTVMDVCGAHPHVLDLLLEVSEVAALQAGATLASLLSLVPGMLLALSMHLGLAACLLQICACTTPLVACHFSTW